MSQRDHATGDAGTGVPQDLVDRLFDRELDEGSRETLFKLLRADLSRCAEVAKTQRMISALREPIEAPDLTDRIMARVGRRRAFLPERLRRMVTVGRLMAAACVLLCVLAVAIIQRSAPDALRLSRQDKPLTNVIESGRNDAVRNAGRLAGIVTSRPPENAAPRRPVLGALTPGRTSVQVLPRQRETAMAIPQGAGEEMRFVFSGGVCIDQRTSAAVAVAAPSADGVQACPDALVEFIKQLAEELQGERAGAGGPAGGKGADQPDPSVVGRRSGK
jgi:hypothetical protein